MSRSWPSLGPGPGGPSGLALGGGCPGRGAEPGHHVGRVPRRAFTEPPANATAPSRPTIPIAIKPSDRVIGTSTANKLPIAQESWNPLSKRANDRARSRDGTSRWTIESKASLPEPAARPIPPERTTATAQCRPQSITPALRAAAPTTTDDPVTIHSSGARLRNLGASKAPETLPSWLAPRARPYQISAAEPRLKVNTRRKVTNPVENRSAAVATAASCSPPGGNPVAALTPGGPKVGADAGGANAGGTSSGVANADVTPLGAPGARAGCGGGTLAVRSAGSHPKHSRGTRLRRTAASRGNPTRRASRHLYRRQLSRPQIPQRTASNLRVQAAREHLRLQVPEQPS